MAFQKAYRLSRTYVFNTACWRKLDGAKLIKPKYSSPSTHIEVDKTRQILMVVKGGKPLGIICVSTGATGNTPEGSFHIQQKHPFTTSGFGGILVRTMGFIGDFAIHGYAPTCRRIRRATAACASRSGPATGSTTSRGSARRSTSTTDGGNRCAVTDGRAAPKAHRPAVLRTGASQTTAGGPAPS